MLCGAENFLPAPRIEFDNVLAAPGRSARSAARPCTRCCGFQASELLPFPGADSIFSSRCGAISGRPRLAVSLSRRDPGDRALGVTQLPEPRQATAPVLAPRGSARAARRGGRGGAARSPACSSRRQPPARDSGRACCDKLAFISRNDKFQHDLAPLRLRDPPLLGEVAQLLAVGLEIPRWLFVVIDRLRYPAIGSGPIRRPYHRYAFSERDFRIYSDSVRHRERQRHQATCLLGPLCAAASATDPPPGGLSTTRMAVDDPRIKFGDDHDGFGASLRILPHIHMFSRLFSRATPNRKHRLDL